MAGKVVRVRLAVHANNVTILSFRLDLLDSPYFKYLITWRAIVAVNFLTFPHSTSVGVATFGVTGIGGPRDQAKTGTISMVAPQRRNAAVCRLDGKVTDLPFIDDLVAAGSPLAEFIGLAVLRRLHRFESYAQAEKVLNRLTREQEAERTVTPR